ncbi:uncharacterized protein LOC133813999 [Humulus lupulus]|uniref:uncharacterized protein LOC133813999 n=1 Tax=Humulus lupulus TaxID=3486 RepID=UPI002B4142DA|nr:uncharacterized protein LOC133813999 [Humulus lupulus]
MVDKFTRERSRIQYARILVEMEVTDNPPKSIQYINEHGQIMEQGVEYEWLPIKCKTCAGFGHSMTDCRKVQNTQWVVKEPTTKKEKKDQRTEGLQDEELEKPATQASSDDGKVQVNPVETLQPNSEVLAANDKGNQASQPWLTPKRVAASTKEGQSSEITAKNSGQKYKKSNKFVVLQEQMNVRGLNGSIKHSPVSDLCSINKIGVGGLLETKMKGNKIIRFMDHQFPNWEFHTSSVIEGRLLIVWRKLFVKVNIIEESNQFVHCLVKMAGVQQDFGVTFLYGFNSIEGRRNLWEGLQRPTLMDKAWLVLGDFNAPFSGKDRSGGKPISDLELVDSVRWLAGAHVEPLKSSTAVFRWETISDHCSCLVRTQPLEKIRLKLFRFYNYWTKHHEFRDLVLYSWDRIGDLKVNYYKAKETYQEAQLQAQAYPHVFSYQEDERIAAEAFSVQERLYHSFLIQRSKITWLRQGDMNTSFFYAFLKKRKAENGSPSSATGRINIQNVEMGSKLSVEQQLKLLKPFSKKEIRDSLFGIPITKSPGPDGFGSGFFKASWQDIGDEVCVAITQCFETGYFPSKLHETTLSLIPKVANPSRAVEYRPIACCSTLYKCMAKLICKRLSLVLPDLVQPNQGAFVKGRSIAHNIMIFQDLIKNYGRTSTSSRCAMKIDLSKAYDTVDWEFLEDLLKALRFPMKFIGWVMSCVRNTSYSLLMNGRVQGKFKGEKGLRQGDPMSPQLFVLIMEYLTRSLQLAALKSPFRYHPMCKSLKLINLCFADDLLLFCKSSISAVRSVKEVLDEFAAATGLSINSGKSHIFFCGVTSNDRTRIAQEINLTEGTFPLKYLGVPMRPTKWRHEDCEVILHKFRLKMQNWASRHLSFTGRIQLIHSVLLGLRNYWMTIFVLPQSIIKEIEKLCRGFLWGTSGQRSKIHIPSWQKVCLPKAYGGLEFRDGASWNRAVLAKYVWAISAKPDLLWVKWINSIYLKGVNIWNYELKENCSWYWRKLCHLKDRFNPAAILSTSAQGKFQSSKLYNSLLDQQRVDYYRNVVNSKLLTRDNLSRLHVHMNTLVCPVCERYPESHSHLFFDCILSKLVVKSIFDWLGFDAWPIEFNSWMVWLARARIGVSTAIVNMVIAAVIYSI